MFPEKYTCNFSFLRETWIKLVTVGFEKAAEYAGIVNSANKRELGYLAAASRSSFNGATPDEVKGYCLQGYKVPGLETIDPSSLPVRKKPKLRRNDEDGDLDFGAVLDGDDRPFAEWTKREQIPGIDVRMSMGFIASTPANVISEYNRFVLRALLAIETSGIDYSLAIFNRGQRRFHGYNGVSEFEVVVKKQGEKTDYLSWSAMLAPGSYRTLGFVGIILSSEHNHRTVDDGFGASFSRQWGVNFDKENKTLTFLQPADARRFPAEQMERELIAALSDAKG
jgi:hypothetical protein